VLLICAGNTAIQLKAYICTIKDVGGQIFISAQIKVFGNNTILFLNVDLGAWGFMSTVHTRGFMWIQGHGF